MIVVVLVVVVIAVMGDGSMVIVARIGCMVIMVIWEIMIR